MIPDATALFNDIKERLADTEIFQTESEASSRYYRIIFKEEGFESIECRDKLTQTSFQIQEYYDLLLEPIFATRTTYKLLEVVPKKSVVIEVSVTPLNYTVKPENLEIAQKLQTLINEFFPIPRKSPTRPEGCLQRVRKKSSSHQ